MILFASSRFICTERHTRHEGVVCASLMFDHVHNSTAFIVVQAAINKGHCMIHQGCSNFDQKGRQQFHNLPLLEIAALHQPEILEKE